jgi:hypothetical protein
MERRPIQYAAGTLAGSAFIATTQILTGLPLDLPLYFALVAFAINIPFQIIIFFVPTPLSTIKEVEEAQRLVETKQQPLSRWVQQYWSIQLFSTYFIVLGFVAMFWHFAWWLGVLFALAAWAAYQIFKRAALEDYKHRPDEYE